MTRRSRSIATVTLAVAAAACAPAPAGAGEHALSADLPSTAKRGGVALDLLGTAGRDRLRIRTAAGAVIVRVPSPATIDCPPTSEMDPTCHPGCTQEGPQRFTCDASVGIVGVRTFTRAGRDRVNAKRARKITKQYGGPGSDKLLGGRKFDLLNGQRGGNDRCRGKRGPETIKNCE